MHFPDHQKPVRAQWVTKGERLGEFRMGSTIVLILEVPLTFKWDVVSQIEVHHFSRVRSIMPLCSLLATKLEWDSYLGE